MLFHEYLPIQVFMIKASAKDRKICMSLSAAKEIQVKAAYENQYQDSYQQLVVTVVICQQQDDENKEYDIVLPEVSQK